MRVLHLCKLILSLGHIEWIFQQSYNTASVKELTNVWNELEAIPLTSRVSSPTIKSCGCIMCFILVGVGEYLAVIGGRRKREKVRIDNYYWR